MSSSTGTGFLGRSSSSNSNMRGLVQFIADLRNARARELEEKRINKELANIRQKFKDGNLSGYHKKKYVCKVCECAVCPRPRKPLSWVPMRQQERAAKERKMTVNQIHDEL